jgi:hypothetical protein
MNTLQRAVSATFIALALSACGGGGGSTTAATVPQPLAQTQQLVPTTFTISIPVPALLALHREWAERTSGQRQFYTHNV